MKTCHGNQNGGALLMVLISLTMIGALGFGALRWAELRASAHRQGALISVRDSLVLSLRREVRLGYNLWESAKLPQNVQLTNCLLNEPGQTPWDCQAGALSPLTLTNADGQLLAGPSPAQAAYYDQTGEPCVYTSGKCTMRVWAEFRPVCPNKWPTCSIARALDVTFYVAMRKRNDEPFADRPYKQLAPVVDWGLGQWQLQAYDATSTRTGSNLGTPTPVAATGTVVATGSAGSTGPAPLPPVLASPPHNSSCDSGERVEHGHCFAFNF